MPTRQALTMAEREGLDLVEISSSASPPVCRIMDLGKYKYDLEKKEREAKKHHTATRMKEVQFHANVEAHDYQTKLRKLKDFVLEGHRVKVSLYFRGRENAHQDLGYLLMKKVVADCEDVASPEQMPTPMGRSLIMMMGPKRGLRQQQQQAATVPSAQAPQAPSPTPAPAAAAPAPGFRNPALR
jgi:translation initiation factor IF-3